MTKKAALNSKLERIDRFLDDSDQLDYLLMLRELAKRSSFAATHPGMIDDLISSYWKNYGHRSVRS